MIITLLRLFFIAVLVSMLGVTTWASQRVALWDIMPGIAEQPWFVATLFDAYFGFLTFYAWVLYKETRWGARGLWLLAILLLGNIAMAVYMLNKLFQLPTNASMEELLLRRGPATP